jgi:hypothetical protein
MTKDTKLINVYLETSQKRTFAVALEWPGWCRSGRDEASALQSLVVYGPRYALVLQSTSLEFRAPTSTSSLVVIERLPGNATTDFGAPSQLLDSDAQPVDGDELQRMQTILGACWRTFDRAVKAAEGKTLRKGPRGGGRDLEKILEHVREVEITYLKKLGGKPAQSPEANRQVILETLLAAAQGKIPARGPRGGLRWPARYFVRRLAWHDLDHAWEIEDRIE